MRRLLPALSLFTSVGTLICCALPALLVTLGLGATLAGIVGTVPQLVWLSEYKGIVFGVAGTMLLAAGVMQWRARKLPCPTDPAQRAACTTGRRWSLVIYGVSLGIYLIGVFFAFIAPRIFF